MDPSNASSPGLDQRELYFLITKFLAAGPCREAAEVLRREIGLHGLLPKRLDWEGEEHDQDFDELESKYQHIGPQHLEKICSRVVPLLDKEFPPVVKNVSSLLGAGRQSLLRTAWHITRQWYSIREYTVRFHQEPIMDPPQFTRQHNIVKALFGRETSGPINRKQCAGPKLYDKLQLYRRTLGHLSAVYCVLFERTGRYIITGADDYLVKIWSATDGRLLSTLRGASSEITDIAVNNENTLLAAGSCDKILRVWCMQYCSPVAVLTGHTGMITSVHFCPVVVNDIRYLVTTSTDGSVAFWSYVHQPGAQQGKHVRFTTRPIQYNERMRPGQAQMICASFSPGGMFLAAGSGDHHVRVYLMEGEEGPHRILETEAHTDRVDSICWAHNELRFISGSKDGTANIWYFERQHWKFTKLQMATKLPGEKETEEDSKVKLKVMMVCWDLTDRFVITAVGDHTLKVWNSDTGALVHVLLGHQDEVFVLESHPCDPNVLLSAAHDGNMFIWNISTGQPIKKFQNLIDGQGHGSIFDAKWSPDGTMIAATDSHGHLITYGLGTGGDKLQDLPKELFFHTDYRPLIRDANHYVLDEQTQMAPHLMPPPFLVDIDGNPYPPYQQRLVPGRENCSTDQLVPNITVGAGGHQEVMGNADPVNPRSHIDEMIAALAQRQNSVDEAGPSNQQRAGPSAGSSAGPSRTPARSVTPGGSSTPAGAGASSTGGSGRNNTSPRGGGHHLVGMRRTGDVEGVRQSSGNWQRDSNLRWTKRVLIPPLSKNALRARRHHFSQYANLEFEQFKREQRRRPVMITVTAPNRGVKKNMIRTGTLRNGAVRGISSLRRSQRSNLGQMDDSDFENPDDIDLGSQSSGNEEEAPIPVSNNRSRTRRINSSSEDEVESIGSSSPASSSEYSDWIADQGASLEPPKRAKKKPVRASARARRAAASNASDDSHSDDETDDSDEPVLEPDSEEERKKRPKPKPKPKPKRRPPIPAALAALPPGAELPEAFRPSEWLAQVVPKKSPYSPQMGDEVVFFKEGFQKYLEAVREKQVYDVGPRYEPYEKFDLQEPQLVKVVGIKYEIKPPRLCCLKLGILKPDEPMNSFFTLKYHDMNDVIDFFVLNQTYQQAMQRNFQEGDQFRSMINDDWWTGVIESKLAKESPFLSIRVQWDSQDLEYMSPWDLEPVDPNRIPEDVGGSVPVLPEEIEATLYQPSEEEWPHGGREETTRRILRGLEQVMGLSIAEDFLTPVDVTLYPSYAYTIEYPIDLSLIKERFENNFYRRITAAQFDVRYLATNAEKFNEPHSPIVKAARIVSDLCLKIIASPTDVDVSEEYHQSLNGYHSSPSGSEDIDVDDDPDQPGPSKVKQVRPRPKGQRKSVRQQALSIDPDDWRRQCIDLLELIWQQSDAEPFREPVDTEEFPDYLTVVKTPMDLSTVRSRLLDEDHGNPHDFARDIRLIFSNSKNFNTNKHSQIFAMTCRLSSLFEDHMKKIIQDWKTAQIRAKTSLLKGKKRIAMMVASGTDESGGDNTRPTSRASSHLSSSAAVQSSSQLKQRAVVKDDDDDDDIDNEQENEEEENDGDNGDEEEDINAPGPSTRVSKINGVSNGHALKRSARASTRSMQPVTSNDGSEDEDAPPPSRPVRAGALKRKQYDSDNSYGSSLQETKRRRTSAVQKNASSSNSRASFNDSDDSSVSAYKPSTRSVNGHGKGKGKGKASVRPQRQRNGKKTVARGDSDEDEEDEDETVQRRPAAKRTLKSAANDTESGSDSSSDSSSNTEEADDSDESEESDESVDLHAPPSRSNRATRSKSNSFGADKTNNGDEDESEEEEEEDDDDDDAKVATRNGSENSNPNSAFDDDKENEEEDDDDDDDESVTGNGRFRAGRTRCKNYNESDSDDSEVSKHTAKKQKQGNRPVRNATRNRRPMQDYASSDDDQVASKSSSRRRKTTKPNYAEDESEEEPMITVSSRGRVRKVTEKARALINKH